jgi:hypothetical protein
MEGLPVRTVDPASSCDVRPGISHRFPWHDFSPIQPSAIRPSSLLLASELIMKRGDEGDDAGAFVFASSLIRFSNSGRLFLRQSPLLPPYG